MKKKILSIIALIVLLTGLLVFSSTVAFADEEYKNTYYALRGNKFTVPDYSADTVVYDPAGDVVNLTNGQFRVSLEGDYVIKYSDGLALLKAYKTAPEVKVQLNGKIPEKMCEGEILYLPEAVGKSDIKDYTEYTVTTSFGSEVYQIEGVDKKFTFTKSGDWKISFVFTDVFGKTTNYSANVSVSSAPVIVLQNFPETLVFGQTLSLEETYGYFNGAMYECSVEAVDALGKTVLEEKTFKARTAGQTKLTFTALINCERVQRTVSFNVEYQASSLFSGEEVTVKSGYTYPSGANVEKNGLLLKGNTGATTVYTKTLDLKKLSENNTNIIEFQPYGKSSSISQIRVTLTDVFDKTNTLSVYWWLNPWNDHLSYMLVEYDDISVAISNENADKGVVRNTYGAVVFHNFTNVKNKNCVPFNFRYDYDEMAVYSAINKNNSDYKVLDTDNVDELKSWKPFNGFNGTEVYLSIEFTVSDGGGIVVSEIGGEKLDNIDQNYFINEGNLQFCRQSKIQNGVVGYEYELPSALENDVFFGQTNFTRRVEYFDNGIFRTVTASDGVVTDNILLAKKSGKFKAVFSGRDNFGKEIEKSFTFEILDNPPDIYISADYVKQLSVCDDFVLSQVSVSGGTGSIAVDYLIYYNGIYKFASPGDRFTLDQKGDLRISVVVTDELGFKKAACYTVAVDMDKRILVTEKMPKACTAGEKLDLPSAKVLDYSRFGKSDFSSDAEIYIQGEKINKNDEYIVPFDVSELQVELRSLSGELSEKYTIAVLSSGINDISDKLIYDRESVTTEFFETGLTFTANKDFSVQAPYALPFSDLALKFTLLDKSMKYDYVVVSLVAENDRTQEVNLQISSVKSGNAVLKVADKQYSINLENGTFNSLSAYNGKKYHSVALAFSLNGSLRVGGSEACVIDQYDSGRQFTAFGGGNVFVTISAVNVTGNSSIVLNYIANQTFNNYTKSSDETSALVGFAEQLKEEYQKGERFVLPQIYLGDVLSGGKVTAKLTVKAPDGEILFKDVNPLDAVAFNLDKYGYYQLVFDLTDDAYNTGKKTFRLYVADRVAPVVQTPNIKDQYAIGDKFVVPNVVVTDDNSVLGDEFNALTVYLYVRNAYGEYIRVEEGQTLTLEKVGNYEFIVYYFDQAMNIAYKVCKFTVR